MKMNAIAAHIYSTLTSTNEYVRYRNNSVKELPIKEYGVIIYGGANVAPRNGLITPYGVKTDVNMEQLEFLINDPLFTQHVNGGWLTIVPAAGILGAPSIDAMVATMAQRDGSAPMVPNDYAERKAPTTGSANPNAEVTSKPRQVPIKQGMFR